MGTLFVGPCRLALLPKSEAAERGYEIGDEAPSFRLGLYCTHTCAHTHIYIHTHACTRTHTRIYTRPTVCGTYSHRLTLLQRRLGRTGAAGCHPGDTAIQSWGCAHQRHVMFRVGQSHDFRPAPRVRHCMHTRHMCPSRPLQGRAGLRASLPNCCDNKSLHKRRRQDRQVPAAGYPESTQQCHPIKTLATSWFLCMLF